MLSILMCQFTYFTASHDANALVLILVDFAHIELHIIVQK